MNAVVSEQRRARLVNEARGNAVSGQIIPTARDNRQRLNLVGRVTACPARRAEVDRRRERSRMGVRRRPFAARRGLRALPFPVAATRGVSVASLPSRGHRPRLQRRGPVCTLL